MRSGKMILAVTALTTMMLTASLALAGPGRGPGGGAGPGAGPCGGGGGCGQALQLSPEKQEAFKKLYDAFYTKTAQLRAAIRVKQAELDAAAVAPTPDQAKIEALSKEIGELIGKLTAERAQFRIQAAKEIGPDALAACPGLGGGFGHRGGGHGGYGPMGRGMMGY